MPSPVPERDLVVRPARPAEAETLARLVNVAYGRTSKEPGWTSEGHLIQGPRVETEQMREIIEEQEGVILVAEAEGSLLACVQLSPEGDAYKLGLLAVRVEAQGKGIGRKLVRAAEDHARQTEGVERIVLNVLTVREELFPWYEDQGYERTGERVPLTLGEAQESTVGALRLEVLEKRL